MGERRRPRFSLCWDRKRVTLRTKLDRSAYVCGESLRVKADIDNQSDEEARLKLRLVQVRNILHKITFFLFNKLILFGESLRVEHSPLDKVWSWQLFYKRTRHYAVSLFNILLLWKTFVYGIHITVVSSNSISGSMIHFISLLACKSRNVSHISLKCYWKVVYLWVSGEKDTVFSVQYACDGKWTGMLTYLLVRLSAFKPTICLNCTSYLFFLLNHFFKQLEGGIHTYLREAYILCT